MKTEKYTDKNGVEKQTTKITADKVEFLSKAGSHQEAQQEPQQQEEESEIPF